MEQAKFSGTGLMGVRAGNTDAGVPGVKRYTLRGDCLRRVWARPSKSKMLMFRKPWTSKP